MLVVLAALWLAAPGIARGATARAGGGSTAPPKAPVQKQKAPPSEQGERSGQLIVPQQLSDGTVARELGSSGQVDPISGLGIRNPVCDQLAQIRSHTTRLACEADGTPESNYPTSNYGFDLFVSTGFTHPIGDVTWAFVMLGLNNIWLGLLFVLKQVFALLGLAFGLNPFGEGQTMSQISATVGRLYERITDPWLSTLIVCGGIWFAYKGLLKRELAAGVAGTVAAVAMLVVGLWVVNQPRASVGAMASLSDEVALGTISAPQSGSLARPVGAYAEAMSNTWTRLVEVPFAGLDFSDVKWALGPPPAEAVQKADEKFCDDYGALALLAVLSNLGSAEAKEACANFAAKRYGRPKRVIDLYLRSSPGSPARQALWDYFNGSSAYKAKVAAQGGGGVISRLSLLALFALGLLGAILLLAWLAIRLFTQAAIAFVLLLAAPFALFFPMLGDAGRRAFKTWGLTLLGAIVAKVIYAAFLSIVLLGIAVLGRVERAGGQRHGLPALLRVRLVGAAQASRADQLDQHRRGRARRRTQLRLRSVHSDEARRPGGTGAEWSAARRRRPRGPFEALPCRVGRRGDPGDGKGLPAGLRSRARRAALPRGARDGEGCRGQADHRQARSERRSRREAHSAGARHRRGAGRTAGGDGGDRRASDAGSQPRALPAGEGAVGPRRP